jgi:hypothetical protein
MASKRRLRAKSCEGKMKHESMAKAHVAAKHTGPDVHPYACRWCGKYHVGHPTHQAKMRRQNGHA